MTRMIAVLLFALPLLWSCTTNMPASEQGNASSERKVLLAGESTAFKQRLAAEIIRTVGTDTCYFRIVGLDQLETFDTTSYRAIVLLAGYRAGRLDGRVTRFLERNPADHRVILFFTRGSDDPLPQGRGPEVKVDALSSASRADRVQQRADQLALLIKERL